MKTHAVTTNMANTGYMKKRQDINEKGKSALSKYIISCTSCGNTSNHVKIYDSGLCEHCHDLQARTGKTTVRKTEYQEDDGFGSF